MCFNSFKGERGKGQIVHAGIYTHTYHLNKRKFFCIIAFIVSIEQGCSSAATLFLQVKKTYITCDEAGVPVGE